MLSSEYCVCLLWTDLPTLCQIRYIHTQLLCDVTEIPMVSALNPAYRCLMILYRVYVMQSYM